MKHDNLIYSILFLQIVCLIMQFITNEFRFLALNIGFMILALLAFKLQRRGIMHKNDEKALRMAESKPETLYDTDQDIKNVR